MQALELGALFYEMRIVLTHIHSIKSDWESFAT